jgi:Ca2+/Na+ antiporter
LSIVSGIAVMSIGIESESEAMQLLRKIRFTMGAIMMFVLMIAAAMALFVKIQQYTDPATLPGLKIDVPSLFLLAIVLTAVAFGSWKEHTVVQIMLQVTLACFIALTLIWISEAQYERAIRYWCQATFAATVTLPMIARRFVKSGMARGPRRDWWKKTCESVFFSFLTMMLVTAGGLFQFAVYEAATNLPAAKTPAPPPTPVLPDPALQNPPPALPPNVVPTARDDDLPILPPVFPPAVAPPAPVDAGG